MTKVAVILFNLGGPDAPDAVRPFLMNFFMDKNIIRVPRPLRDFIAWNIARKRSRKEARASYGELGGSSPLLANTQKQAEALQTVLEQQQESGHAHTYKVFVCMRYWHPMSAQVAAEIQNWGAEQVILLPLYPQYSTTTTRSSFQVWQKACRAIGFNRPTKLVCCYPENDGYVQASVKSIRKTYQDAQKNGHTPRILFSAHGLPEKIVQRGDPYQVQCERSAEKIVQNLGLENPDWQICYQSRVGPLKWIGPSTEEALHEAAKDNVPVLIYPHAFTQEHVETLVELDIEYKHLADRLGLKGYYRAETVGIKPDFIKGLAEMVISSQGHADIASDTGSCLCPSGAKECCMREYGNATTSP
ncbi:MAG: ferrochelatase [Rhodospirillales bacterium]|nr:ferrochelatase [Rhodospirillales bacterium]MCB9964665.1 ferrochelatase [Rhodospirillales bacterium]MCB9979955.1 ferrochelatase [Rhodospirillales bacterium]